MMTLEQIKSAVDAGRTVCHHNKGYQVKKSQRGEYYIICTWNDYNIGLTWQDGVTMNGKPEDFYTLDDEEERIEDWNDGEPVEYVC